MNLNLVKGKLKDAFPCSDINLSNSGLCNVFIPKDNKQEMIRAFQLLKGYKEKFVEGLDNIIELIKDISITQSNLENIFIEVYVLNFSYVIYIKNEIDFKILIIKR